MNFNKPLTEGDFFLQSFGDTLEGAIANDDEQDKPNLIKSILEADVTSLEDSENVEETEDEEDSEQEVFSKKEAEQVEDKEEIEEDTIFEKTAKELNDKGVSIFLPEGITEIPDLETFVKVIEHNNELKEQEILENVYKDLNKRLDPFTRQIIDFALDVENNGGDVIDFAKSILTTVDVAELDTNDIQNQIEINRQYYLATGVKAEKVEKILDSLKENPEKLKAEAEENKPELVELMKKESLKQKEAQELIKQEEEELRTYFSGKLANQLQTLKIGSIDEGIEEFPITKEQAKYLYQTMSGVKYKIPIKGKEVEMERLEALAHYHRYSEGGNLNRLLTAMLILEEPKVVFNHFLKSANSKVVKEVKNQNNFSNNTGLTFTKKKPTVAKTEKSDVSVFAAGLK